MLLQHAKDALQSSYPSDNSNLAEEYLWEIWAVKSSGQRTEINLLYSWVIPNTLTKRGWQPAVQILNETATGIQGKPCKVLLVKAAYCGKGMTIKRYIDGLLDGNLLSEIQTDEEFTAPPEEFLNLGLADSAAEIKDLYIVRPEVLLPVEHALIPWQNKAIPNPVAYSVFVSQLVYLDKLGLISFDGIIDDPKTIKNMIGKISASLRKDTGFDISRSSAPRIGNIEWYRFPLADESLTPLVKVRVIKPEGEKPGLGVEVCREPYKKEEQAQDVLIRCRLINGEEVSLDECRSIRWGVESQKIQFHADEPVSEIHVGVWKKDPATGNGFLIFEDQQVCVRSLRVNMSIIGSKINAGKMNLLTKLHSKAEHEKAKQLAVYPRSTKANSTSIEDYSSDPWVSAGRAAIKYMEQVFPAKSEGRFFLNGWDAEKEASGHLSFVEWMLDIVSGEDRGGLILIDPFFDKDGVEIFSHARTTNTQYRVLTCTQHREPETNTPSTSSSDPVPDANPTMTTNSLELTETAKSIRSACLIMLPLLRDLNFTISDLRSPNGGSTQLFHDRYLLLTDANGQVSKGYHLSNSIQGATKRAPLLVTPIPSDILPDVLSYVETLLDPDPAGKTDKQTELMTIYPVPEDAVKPKINESGERAVTRSKLAEIPDAEWLFSTLLDDSAETNASPADLEDQLKRMGLIEKTSGSFLLHKLTPEQIARWSKWLTALDQESFNKAMTGFGELRARSQTGEACQQFKDHIRGLPLIGQNVRNYLETFTTTEKLIGYRDRLYDIFRPATFEEALEFSIRKFNHMHRDFGIVPYGYYYAAEILVDVYPDLALDVFGKMLYEAGQGNWNEADGRVKARMLLISVLATNFLSYQHIIDLEFQAVVLSSPIASLRGASSAALISALLPVNQTVVNAEAVLSQLKKSLSEQEFRLSIAAYIAELFIMKEGGSKLIVDQRLFAILTENWTGNMELINRVTAVLSGRLPFNHALEIQDNFLSVLNEKGILTVSDCFFIWQTAFLRKVSFRETFTNRGSEGHMENFVSNTDPELTCALIKTFDALGQDEQDIALEEWLKAIEPMWPLISHPLAAKIDNSYSGCAERIYWLAFIMRMMLDNELLSGHPKEIAGQFMESHVAELASIGHFIDQQHFSQVKELQRIQLKRSEEADTSSPSLFSSFSG